MFDCMDFSVALGERGGAIRRGDILHAGFDFRTAFQVNAPKAVNKIAQPIDSKRTARNRRDIQSVARWIPAAAAAAAKVSDSTRLLTGASPRWLGNNQRRL